MSDPILSSRKLPEYHEVSMSILKRMKGNWSFDVYIKRAENAYTKLFKKADPIDIDRLAGYSKDKGVEAMYVQHGDYRKYTLYEEEVANVILSDKTFNVEDIDDITQVIKEISELALIEIFVQQHVDADSIHHVNLAMKGCIDLLKQDPKSLIRMVKMLLAHAYQLKHAMSVCVYALLLAKMDGILTEKNLTHIALGALLHDLGMATLTFNSETESELSPEQYKELRSHPQISKRLMESTRAIPWEARTIALQHHEQPNGMGYPNGLHDKEIYRPAKIVAIADSFSALTSSRPYRDYPYTAIEAIEIMSDDRGHYDADLLAKFKKLFVKVGDQAA